MEEEPFFGLMSTKAENLPYINPKRPKAIPYSNSKPQIIWHLESPCLARKASSASWSGSGMLPLQTHGVGQARATYSLGLLESPFWAFEAL